MDVYLYKKDARGHLLAPAVTNFHAEIRSTRSSTPLIAASARDIAVKVKTYLTEARRDAAGEDIFIHFSAPCDIRWRPGEPYPAMGGDSFLTEERNTFHAAFFAHPK